MTRQLQFSNNASSRLAANITSSATSLSVTPGDGAEFPSLSAGQFFMATLVKSDGTTEVVKVTARTTDTFTVVRAAEAVAGTTLSYAFTAGDKIEARLTAESLGTELSRLDAAAYISATNKTANYTVVETDISSLVRMDTGGGSRTVTLPSIASLTQDFDVIVSKVTSDANTLTITRASTDTINGAATYVLYSQFQSAWLIADRTNNTWTVITSANTGNNVIVDPFTGDGVTTAFTLSGDPISKNNTALFIGGVYQNKASYTLSGTTITPGGTVANGVTIEVVWAQPLIIGVPSDGSVTTAKIGDAAVTTGKIADASVTTAKIPDANITAAKIASGAAVTNIGYTPVDVASLSGQVAFFAGSTAPAGWIKANGALVSRTTYAALFAAIGTTFGVGDGSTTFNLPDLRGEFPRGWDDGRGVDSGRAFGSAQLDQMQTITGSLTQTSGVSLLQSNATGAGALSTSGTANRWSGLTSAAPQPADKISFNSANSPSARAGTETRGRNIALLACIKF